ncbi:bifunctional folylpolyglutamate synthase/dihydrofolate synthase [Rhodovulum adriaticum]|uniref:Dihydrofolate synthase/folylpolyglutamate synthase n=1 Tax=Rhodovulum adriaticum TaxID=35804 RepID=A0A4R2NIU6_RHOAD|nr:folylpolyglutamate synthase/dihydrofolate synthase family protein [Rhodovulum adriaticum]MBK1635881.1 bifunctional folylpolyglutamate synthase/dihydrofolate synthase [Rhodovulum adriaticum]TCP21423.1 dihydrofolate synthase/folylpolyglutamate synthase [Rhodovulum adriaticum]
MTAATSDILLDRMMSLHPKVIDLTLDRVWRLLAALDHPEQRLAPVIHIAGTNGKGSTLAMIRAGLQGAGKRVQAYTSPHLARFHERIRLTDGLISEPALAAVLDECDSANAHAPITYFEITTCAALLAFARDPADYCLLEVGLGGRLDATNVIDRPALTVITPISIDHQQFLGDTLPQIAAEKAGILKRGVPCVVGPQQDAALQVIEDRAARLGAPLLAHGQHWHVWQERERLIYQDERGLLDLPLPRLIGPHQVQNAGTALAALRALDMGDPAYEAAMTDAEWPARMQRLRTGPLVQAAGRADLWLDGGHNPAAGTALAAALATLPPRPVHLVCGMLNTKDVTGFMAPLAQVAETLTAVSIPGEANTLPAETAAAAARQAGLTATTADSVTAAVTRIAADSPNARIVICGSLYLAGRVLRDNA